MRHIQEMPGRKEKVLLIDSKFEQKKEKKKNEVVQKFWKLYFPAEIETRAHRLPRVEGGFVSEGAGTNV